ncbi:MAG: NTP transferase domain-containing protein [Anaerolineales bacterium]
MAKEIAAIVLAAGLSRRMGRPKMLLPWGGQTVLGQVLFTLREAGIEQRIVITGAEREQVEEIARREGAECLYNPDYASGEMLSSIQVGLQALESRAEVEAALICLGDQPQIEIRVVQEVVKAWCETHPPLIVPTHAGRRGHPWLVARIYWREILALRPPATARTFLHAHTPAIHLVPVATDSILKDLDTPQEYEKEKPDSGEWTVGGGR